MIAVGTWNEWRFFLLSWKVFTECLWGKMLGIRLGKGRVGKMNSEPLWGWVGRAYVHYWSVALVQLMASLTQSLRSD